MGLATARCRRRRCCWNYGPQMGLLDSQPSLGRSPAITHICMINRTAPGELLGIQFMLPEYPISTSTHFNRCMVTKNGSIVRSAKPINLSTKEIIGVRVAEEILQILPVLSTCMKPLFLAPHAEYGASSGVRLRKNLLLISTQGAFQLHLHTLASLWAVPYDGRRLKRGLHCAQSNIGVLKYY